MPGIEPGIFDLHLDTPLNIMSGRLRHVDPARLHADGYWGVVFAHFVKPGDPYPFVTAVRLIAATLEYARDCPTVGVVRSPAEISRERLNIILGVEGGHIFDDNLKQVEVLYELGVRVFTITWNNSNRLAHAALDDDRAGLTARGRDLLQATADYGIIIDLSHAATRTAIEVCAASPHPVIASHSCVRNLHPFVRNIDDEAIRAIARRNGVVGVNVSRFHLGAHSFADHVRYLAQEFGPEIPAVGSDFDGIDDPVVPGPAALANLCRELGPDPRTGTNIAGLASANFLRVFSSACG